MRILDHKATWLILGAVGMYFAFPYVAGLIPHKQASS